MSAGDTAMMCLKKKTLELSTARVDRWRQCELRSFIGPGDFQKCFAKVGSTTKVVILE